MLTATALCWTTNYGFTKFYWVITKWVLTTGLVVFGTFWLFPWGNEAEQLAAQSGLQALDSAAYAFDAKGVLIGTLVQAVFLVIIMNTYCTRVLGNEKSRIILLEITVSQRPQLSPPHPC